MVFPQIFAGFLAQALRACSEVQQQQPKQQKHVVLLALDMSGSESCSMNDTTIYEVQGSVSKAYSIEKCNSGTQVEVHLALWSNDCSEFTKLNTTQHLLTKRLPAFQIGIYLIQAVEQIPVLYLKKHTYK